MLALFYLLGFLSAAAIAFLLQLIYRAKAKKADSVPSVDEGFRRLIEY